MIYKKKIYIFLIFFPLILFADKIILKKKIPIFKDVYLLKYERTTPPLKINVIKIPYLDNKEFFLKVEAAKNTLKGREKLSEIAKRVEKEEHLKVIAGINGDFWGNYGIPIGNLIEDNWIKHVVYNPRSGIYFNKDIFTLGLFKIQGFIKINNQKLNIDTVNTYLPSNKVVLINRFYYKFPLKCNNGFFLIFDFPYKTLLPDKIYYPKLKAKANQIKKLSTHEISIFIPSQKSDIIKKIKIGKKYLLQFFIKNLTNISNATCGGPLILKDSKNVVSEYVKIEDIKSGFESTRHPRTAVGIDKKTHYIYFLTVDGRQPSISVGMNLYELADFFKNTLNCDSALNLDGGGSTTMYVRGKIVNNPSDAIGERSIATSILLCSRKKQGNPKYLYANYKNIYMYPQSEFKLVLKLYDEYFNELPLYQKFIKYEYDPSYLCIEKNKVRALGKSGETKINIYYKNLKTSVKIIITKDISISLPPNVIGYKGQIVPFPINIEYKNHKVIYPQKNISVKNDVVKYKNGKLLLLKSGIGELRISVCNRKFKIPYKIGTLETKILDDFTKNKKYKISGQGYDKNKTFIKLVKTGYKDKSGLLMQYKLMGQKLSVIYLKTTYNLPPTTIKIGFYVKGDKSKNWLRGIIEDKDKEKFLIDFTSNTKGIVWNNWRKIEVSCNNVIPYWSNPGAKMNFPIKLITIYLAQTQVKLKKESKIILDKIYVKYIKFTKE